MESGNRGKSPVHLSFCQSVHTHSSMMAGWIFFISRLQNRIPLRGLQAESLGEANHGCLRKEHGYGNKPFLKVALLVFVSGNEKWLLAVSLY